MRLSRLLMKYTMQTRLDIVWIHQKAQVSSYINKNAFGAAHLTRVVF